MDEPKRIDTWQVREVALGDCKRLDLLFAFSAARSQRMEQAKHETFYRLLLERAKDDDKPIREQLNATMVEESFIEATQIAEKQEAIRDDQINHRAQELIYRSWRQKGGSDGLSETN